MLSTSPLTRAEAAALLEREAGFCGRCGGRRVIVAGEPRFDERTGARSGIWVGICGPDLAEHRANPDSLVLPLIWHPQIAIAPQAR